MHVCTQTGWKHFGEHDGLWQECVCVHVSVLTVFILSVWKILKICIEATEPRVKKPLESTCGRGYARRPQ